MLRPLAPILLLLLAGAFPCGIEAHGGDTATVIVPADHINPGEVFSLIASDFGSDAMIQFSIAGAGTTVALGSANAGPDGHCETNLELPSGFPMGVADLIAVGDDGTRTTTQVQVGPRTPPADPPPVSAFWQDPSVGLLGAIVAAALLVIAWALLRNRPRHKQVAAAELRQRVRRKPRRR